jgi:hypothetical protein
VRGKINQPEEARRRHSPKWGEGGGGGSISDVDAGSPVVGGVQAVEGDNGGKR